MKPVPKRTGLIVVDLSDQGEIVARDARGQSVMVQISEALKQRLQPSAAPMPGTVMPDGTVYAGLSPDTGRAFYAAANDAPKLMTWNDATAYARASTAHGHSDWRVPTMNELDVIFNNSAAIGGFNASGSLSGGMYWSSSKDGAVILHIRARDWTFSDGSQIFDTKSARSSVRCVRGLAP
jgi:hypothetical protein